MLETYNRLKKLGFQPVGLHQHLGSGWTEEDFPVAIKAVDRMIKKARELKKAGFNLEFLDLGGGFGPKYRAEERLFPLAEYAAYIWIKWKEPSSDLKPLLLNLVSTWWLTPAFCCLPWNTSRKAMEIYLPALMPELTTLCPGQPSMKKPTMKLLTPAVFKAEKRSKSRSPVICVKQAMFSEWKG
jgi:Diaminopimelate decarboxylase